MSGPKFVKLIPSKDLRHSAKGGDQCHRPDSSSALRDFLIAAGVIVASFGLPGSAIAEGTAQFELGQGYLNSSTTDQNQNLYVDILNSGEVINISACGDANDDDLEFRLFDPGGSEVTFNGEASPGITLTDGNVDCSDPFTGPLTNAVKYTTGTTGTYRLTVRNLNGGSRPRLDRLDVTVTTSASVDPDPTGASATSLTGRLYSLHWRFDALGFEESNATDADFYMLTPGGVPDTNYVWQLDLNRFAGFVYDIVGNSRGADSPNAAGQNVAGLTVQQNSDNSFTPEFPVYVNFPEVAQAAPSAAPGVTGFGFVDDENQDGAISPSGSVGIQDSGTFEFTTDVTGTYGISIDANEDGIFGNSGDTILLGAAVPGFNQVFWDGRDNSGDVLPTGQYQAELIVRTGEFHFIAADAETSGGPGNDGLTIYQATSASSRSSTLVYWDDLTIFPSEDGPNEGTANTPDGAFSGTPEGFHTWGVFSSTGSANYGDQKLIDTYVYGLSTKATTSAAIIDGDEPVSDGTITITPTSVPGDDLTVTVTDTDRNIDNASADSVSVILLNDVTGESESVVLTETGADTGIFVGTIATTFGEVAGTDNDGSFNSQAGDTITATYEDEFNSTNTPVNRTAAHSVEGGVDGTVTIPATSRPGETISVSVADADLNSDAGVAETVTVQIVNDSTGEAESVVLTETGNDTGVFTGSVGSQFGAAAGTDDDGSFNTQAGDTLTVSYADGLRANGGSDTITAQNTVQGGENGTVSITPDVQPGDTVIVSVTDADLNSDAGVVETVQVQVVNDVTGETEEVTLTETGANTGIFQATLATEFGDSAGTDNDGTISAQAGDTFTATYNDTLTETGNAETRTDQGTVTGGATGVVDITDQSLPGEAVTLSLSDADVNADSGTVETVDVQVTNDVTGELETVTLTETGADTGIFTATLDTTFGETAGVDDDGVINTKAGDTLTLIYNDALVANGASASLNDTGNVQGGITGTVTIDSPIRPGESPLISIADTDPNTDPATAETISIVVINDVTGESESVVLTETGVNTGIFQRTVSTIFGTSAGADDDGTFNVQAGDTLTVTYNDALTDNGGTASPTSQSNIVGGADGIILVSPASQPGDAVALSVSDADLNTDSGTAETVIVQAVNDATGEVEAITLTETGPDTGTFEATMLTEFGATAGVDNDGVFNTKAGDTLTFTYSDAFTSTGGSAAPTARNTVNGGVSGNVAISSELTPGEELAVSVTDADLNTDSAAADTVSIVIVNDVTGESETVLLTETGPDTGTFESTVPTVFGSAAGTDNDGQFNIAAGHTLTATYDDQLTDNGGTASPTDTATVNGGTDGVVATTIETTPGQQVAISVTDADLNGDAAAIETVTVTITQERTGETETVLLTETAVDSGEFEGSVPTVFGTGAGSDDDGDLTVQAGDTVTTQYDDGLTSTGSNATRQTSTAVIGGATGVASISGTIVPGEILDLEVTDADLNTDPALVETIAVPLQNDVSGETETVSLTETGPDTGVFSGQLPTVFGTVAGTDNDGVINVQAADTVTLTYDDALTATGSTAAVLAQATVIGGGDGAISITPASEPGDTLVVVVTDNDLNADPASAESVVVTLVNDETGETETVTLLETGPDTGAFQGTAETIFGDEPGVDDDGTFNTQANDTITATYNDALTTTGGTSVQTAQNTVGGGVDGSVSATPSVDPGDTLTITVDDSDLDTDSSAIETVTVSVTNQETGETETVILTETGPATGVFEAALTTGFGDSAGTNDDGIIAVQAGDTLTTTYTDTLSATGGTTILTADTGVGGGSDGDIVTPSTLIPGSALAVTVEDSDLNENSGAVETVQVRIVNDVTGEVETVDLVETGADTGIFATSIATEFGAGAGTDEDGVLTVRSGDMLTATYEDDFSANGGTATATSVTTITNLPPVANDDSGATQPGDAVSIPVLANDSDAEGQALTISSVTQPDNGAVSFSPGGSLIYTPAAGFSGTDSFTYTIDDGAGGTATATVSVAVDDNTPTAVADSAGTQPDAAVTIAVLANDSDPNGDTLNVVDVADPANGTASVNPDGTVTYVPDTGFTGTDSFLYTVCDESGNCDEAVVSVSVDTQNPQAVDDVASISAGNPVTVDPAANDTDPNGDDLSVTAVTDAANGTVVLNTDGTVSYSPDTGFVGADTITYTICDPEGNCATATLTVNVINNQPVANDDSGATQPGDPVSIPVLANDSDPEGESLTITAVSQPDNGSVTFMADGTVIYTPDAGFAGTDSFTYTVADTIGDTATATVTVTVDSNTPTAVADSVGTQPDTPVSVDILANDSDPNNDPLTVTEVSVPANGSTAVDADGTVVYTPDPGFIGTDTFTYTVCDSISNCDNATVSVTVSQDTPQAVDDVAEVLSGTSASFAPLANDTDPNGDLLTLADVAEPANGAVVVNPDGTISYTPNPGFVGVDSISYTVCDTNENCDTATITVSITNRNPVANDDSSSVAPGDMVAIPVLANDSDAEDQALRIAGVTQPANGTVSFAADGTVVYTPDAGFVGNDSFTYTVEDEFGGTATASVSITVDDDTPTAIADSTGGPPEVPVTVDVLANDSDINGDILSVVSVTSAANGSVVINSDGTLTYTPSAGFTGADSFSYTACDPDGNCDTAIVSIVISDNAPQAGDIVVSIESGAEATVDPLQNSTDPSGDELTVTDISEPANGSLVVNPDGTITYSPDPGFVGSDTVTFSVCDPDGFCDTATITVTVGNQKPQANDDSAATQPGEAVSIPVTANDSDPEGQLLTVSEITQPGNGVVIFGEDGTVIYTPSDDFTGQDSFTYTVSDGLGGTATATVTIIVDNATPTAVADSLGTLPETPVTIDVVANDSDPNGDTLTVTDLVQPENGNVILNPDGTVTFIPDPGFTGTDTFIYTVCDDNGNCDSATVSVVVDTNMPIAEDDLVDATAGSPATFDPLANDTDPNGGKLTISEVTEPANGELAVNPDGTITYTPDPGYQGVETITYWVCTDTGFCDSATITIDTRATATLQGIVFLDQNADDEYQENETLLSGYLVEVVTEAGEVIATTTTNAGGAYEVEGLAPGNYMIKFRNPETGTVAGFVQQENLSAGENVIDLNLPVDPSGVVYNAVTGAPLSGIELTITDSNGVPLPEACVIDPSQQNQVTGTDGMYRFDLVPGAAPECPASATEYLIDVSLTNGLQAVFGAVPANQVVTPSGFPAGPLDAATCPIDAVPGPVCEVSPSPAAPASAAGALFYTAFLIGSGVQDVVNNHIPVSIEQSDQPLTAGKIATVSSASTGSLVSYVITVSNSQIVDITGTDIVDILPPGFKYVAGSGRVNGAAIEPDVDGRTLSWSQVDIPAGQSATVNLVLIVGAGVQPGRHVNQAYADSGATDLVLSNTAEAQVRIVPDEIFDCSEVIGKVFNDRNGNGYQDDGEDGLAGVRIATVKGLLVMTDEYGRYHIACAATPRAGIGSNFILKVDPRTLPSGYRLTTENPRVIRLTQGKMSKANFGASPIRNVRLDITAAAFVEETLNLTSESLLTIARLIEVLDDQHSVLTLVYEGPAQGKGRERMERMQEEIRKYWDRERRDYDLVIETRLVSPGGEGVE